MPPAPKDPAVRQRTNKKAEQAELTPPVDVVVPVLPNPDERTFHKLTLVWWENVWKSPMAARFLTTDHDALAMAALLVDDFYNAANSRERLVIAAEIRQQTARFGLSNWDRNRMNWTISQTPEQKPMPRTQPAGNDTDPRKVLKFSK